MDGNSALIPNASREWRIGSNSGVWKGSRTGRVIGLRLLIDLVQAAIAELWNPNVIWASRKTEVKFFLNSDSYPIRIFRLQLT